MKRIRTWVSNLGLRGKLIFYGYLIITPVLIVICIGLAVSDYQKVIATRLENDTISVESLAESIELLQTDVKDISTYICINEEIHDLLSEEDAQNLNDLNGNARVWQEEAPMEVVQDIISLKGEIKTIAIYPENGITPYLRGMDGSVHLSTIDDVRKTRIYQETIDSDNGFVWQSVPEGSGDIYLVNRTSKLVLTREIFDLSQQRTLGYLVIGISTDQIQQFCENILQDESDGVLVLDPNSGVLVSAGDLDEDVTAFLTTREFIETDYRERPTRITYGDYSIVCTQLGNTFSIICKITPRYEMQITFMDIAYMPLTLMLGILAGMLPLLIIISNLVVKPLSRVSEAMQEFSKGDFEQRVVVTTGDEVGEVAQCFNKMAEDIRVLINENYVITLREKESELAALQAQINPHFLYNTLDSLYWQATGAGDDETAESILALSQLFRMVLNQGKTKVTAEEELELVSRYLQIQKMRFTSKLSYEVVMSDDVKQVKIPKLIVQLFVENAIVHGFDNVSTPCFLRVSAKVEGNMAVFMVEDTGVGMWQEQLDTLHEEEPENYSRQRVGRFAIRNILERLQLEYREDFQLDIQSERGKGTTVIIRIPRGKA